TAILTMYRSDNNSNYMKWVNKDFDAAMDQAASRDANDSAKRYEDLLKANDILVDSAACPPLYQLSSPVLQRSSVHGLVDHLAGVQYRFKYVTVK
ncbi:peptide ABC transporter substrate-binding protein, partial [Lacticaseibacillus paracasei]|nr:peptide ABC transporter substrate-binding protein [Lacticaseibacillus paracasei]